MFGGWFRSVAPRAVRWPWQLTDSRLERPLRDGRRLRSDAGEFVSCIIVRRLAILCVGPRALDAAQCANDRSRSPRSLARCSAVSRLSARWACDGANFAALRTNGGYRRISAVATPRRRMSASRPSSALSPCVVWDLCICSE